VKDEEFFELTPEGVNTIYIISELFRNTDLDTSEIAERVGLDTFSMSILMALGDQVGVTDAIEEIIGEDIDEEMKELNG
jgi:hypothetical protein